MKENAIEIKENNHIVIHDQNTGKMVIDPNDDDDSQRKLQRLDNVQLTALKKLVDKHPTRINPSFQDLIIKTFSIKNMVGGDVSDVQSMIIGDAVHHHYHYEKKPIPKELTTQIPKTSPDKIIGREADLEDLHDRLFNHKQVLLVNGIGGIGKTTLAQAYISKYWDEYRHIAWISQSSEDFSNDFVTTEGLIDNLSLISHGGKTRELFNALVAQLRLLDPGPNLIILDNSDCSLAKWHDCLPGQPLWHILVTSRECIPKFDIKELDFLQEEEGIDLFFSHYTRGKLSRDEVRDIVNLVDRHTLTIEILAKTAQLQRSDIDALKNAIENDLKANVHIEHKGEKIERVTSYLCSIFNITRLSDNELWLLSQFVCLPFEFYAYGLLESLINPEASQKEDVFSETLGSLAEKGWLLCNSETDSYKMHRIIADVLKKKHTIRFEEVEPLIDEVNTRLYLDETKDNPIDKFPWVPFGKSILVVFPDSDETLLGTLCNDLALRFQDLGDYRGAKDLLEKALGWAEKNFGVDHPTTALRNSNLGSVLHDLGDYRRAKDLLEKALRADEKNFGADHPRTAVRNSNLGLVLQDLGDYRRAKDLLEKALRSAEKNFGVDHPMTAVSNSNLGSVLHDLGDYRGAKDLLEKALRSAEKNFGADHPRTATSYSNLAAVLQDLREYDRALELVGKALRVFRDVLPAGHPYIEIVTANYEFIQEKMNED